MKGWVKLEQKEGERITALETQLLNLTKSIERIEIKLDAYSSNFIPRSEADLRFGQIEKEMSETKNNKRSNIALWISGAAVAVTFYLAY